MSRKSGILAVGLAAPILALAAATSAVGAEIHIAVASNVAPAIQEIVGRFEEQTGHRVVVAVASTGKHYAQIENGAPFDAFFAADVRRPKLLEEEGRAVAGTRFTYALGSLVLWSPSPEMVDAAGEVLESDAFRFLSLANPRLAPYGRAAQQVLEELGLWQSMQSRIVRGENIGQAFQFVASGNAEIGFVARSQIERPGQTRHGSWWEVPGDLHSPIEQQAVLLVDDPVAREFLAYVRTKEVAEILSSFGYEIP